jgi:UTP--glucose-1-phosphate uridylyltransferase
MLPASKAVPKEMLNIVEKPVIQYVVEEIASAGIEDILIITGGGIDSEDHFDYSYSLSTSWSLRARRMPGRR